MNPPMEGNPSRRILVTYAGPEAFAPMTKVILAKMGYAIVTPREFDSISLELDRDRPDVVLADERSLGDVPEADPCPPIIVLSGRHGVTGADPRIAGAVRRPAGMHELFRVVQDVLEEYPRLTPRVATHLTAQCSRQGKEWQASVLSLSENGCLIRSPETLLLGSRLALHFQLPRSGALEFDAETAYQLVPDVGLIFHATSPAVREAISDYVQTALLKH